MTLFTPKLVSWTPLRIDDFLGFADIQITPTGYLRSLGVRRKGEGYEVERDPSDKLLSRHGYTIILGGFYGDLVIRLLEHEGLLPAQEVCDDRRQ